MLVRATNQTIAKLTNTNYTTFYIAGAEDGEWVTTFYDKETGAGVMAIQRLSREGSEGFVAWTVPETKEEEAGLFSRQYNAAFSLVTEGVLGSSETGARFKALSHEELNKEWDAACGFFDHAID